MASGGVRGTQIQRKNEMAQHPFILFVSELLGPDEWKTHSILLGKLMAHPSEPPHNHGNFQTSNHAKVFSII